MKREWLDYLQLVLCMLGLLFIFLTQPFQLVAFCWCLNCLLWTIVANTRLRT